MILGPDRAITRKEARGLFAKSFITTRRSVIYPMLCETVDSYSERDFAAHIGNVPQMDPADPLAELVDAPAASDFYDYEISWKNRLHKAKFWISRSLMEFDQTGQVFSLLQSLGSRMANFPDRLFFHRLVNATGTTWGASYTSSALFANSHTFGAQTVDNLLSGTMFNSATYSYSNLDAMAQSILRDFNTAKAQMLSFKDDQGQPFHSNHLDPNSLVILCGPLLEQPMRMAFGAKQLGASTNIGAGQVKAVLTSNYLPATVTDAGAFDWYLANVTERNRPFVYSRFRPRRASEMQDKLQDLKGVDGMAGTTMEDLRELSANILETNLPAQGTRAEADVIENDRFIAAVRWRGEILPGEPRNIIKVDNSAST